MRQDAGAVGQNDGNNQAAECSRENQIRSFAARVDCFVMWRLGCAGMSGFTTEIACIEQVIENEIKQGLTQKQIAQTYALGIRSTWPTDWAKVNAMIIERWSKAGLERIKKMAWSGSCFPST